MHKYILILILLISTKALSFEELMFKPLTANIIEPRIGAFYQFQPDKLRLDIGSSVDLTGYRQNAMTELRCGADFYTFTRLRSEDNFKFPVETSDYYFGVNVVIKHLIECIPTYLRIRFAHISSHMVDGLAKDSVFNPKPFVYSREFLDVIWAMHFDSVRLYAGGSWVYSRKPSNGNAFVPQLGLDFSYPLSTKYSIVGGYDFKLLGFDGKYLGASAAQAGVLWNASVNAGIMWSVYFYNGASFHGMFFKERDSYIGTGFQVVFY